MSSQHQQKPPVTTPPALVSQLSANSVPALAIEEIRGGPSATSSFVSTNPSRATNATNFSGTPCITVQPVTIGTTATHTVSPVLSLVQASNGQVYLIQQQQQSTTTHHHTAGLVGKLVHQCLHHVIIS